MNNPDHISESGSGIRYEKIRIRLWENFGYGIRYEKIRIRDPVLEKLRIQDTHSGSATLVVTCKK